MFNVKKFSLELFTAVSVVAMTLTPAVANEPATEDQGTVCRTATKEIYNAKSTDIDEFKATRKDLRLVNKQWHSDKKVMFYQFEPGPVYCVIKKPE